MNRKTVYILVTLLVVVGSVYMASQKRTAPANVTTANPTPKTTDAPSAVIGQRTKTLDCVANADLEDTACTPGAVFSTATKEQICVKGYSASVRNVPMSKKNQVYQEYGIASHTNGQYEVDHLVSLELGGSNDIANLWPEAADPTPGFHQKDAVENYLHSQVCNGSLALVTAQQEIATNWLAIYNQMQQGIN